MNKTIIVYTIIDDILKIIGHKSDRKQKMNDSEVITTTIIAMLMFAGNIEKARCILRETGLIPDMLSRSRLNRRIHALSDLVYSIFVNLAQVFKRANLTMEYVIDSFPLPVCDNIRISRCRMIRSEEFRGKCASRRRYFYGVKVQVIASIDGIPVEVAFIPGSHHDTRAFDVLDFDLPEGSILYSDNGYEIFEMEDLFWEQLGIKLAPQRAKISSRQDDFATKLHKSHMRKKIETVFSLITQLFPKKLHAVTFKGFLLKAFLFILAFTLDRAFCSK